MGSPSLTIGIATRNDPNDWATINGIQLVAGSLLPELDIVVVDNSPEGSNNAANLESHLKTHKQVRYFREIGPESSCLWKNKVFEYADSDVVLYLDSHVLLTPNSIPRIIEFFQKSPDSQDLLMGPCYSSVHSCQGTNQIIYGSEGYELSKNYPPEIHQGAIWRGHQLGIWTKDQRGMDPNGEPFEIMQQGTFMMACRKDAWPSFHPQMRGFGGNETYLMEKIRRNGGRVLCHPGVVGIHNFLAPNGKPYTAFLEDRIRNYLVGFMELDLGNLVESTLAFFSQKYPNETQAALKAAERISGGDVLQERTVSISSPVPKKPKLSPPYESDLARWSKAGGDRGGSIPKPLYSYLYRLVTPNMKTLEYGTGLSTLVFDAKGSTHTAIEQNNKWINRIQPFITSKSLTLIHSPLNNDGWYQWSPDYGTLYNVILVDGPSSRGRRGALPVILNHLAPGGFVFIDDTIRDEEKELVVALEENGFKAFRTVFGMREYTLLKMPPRPLGVGPGTTLINYFASRKIPACQLCYATAHKMNDWYADEKTLEAHMDEIVEEMLPRTRLWWKNLSTKEAVKVFFSDDLSAYEKASLLGTSVINTTQILKTAIRLRVNKAVESYEASL